jgi:Spy/CpxP family protein refolding chaperone
MSRSVRLLAVSLAGLGLVSFCALAYAQPPGKGPGRPRGGFGMGGMGMMGGSPAQLWGMLLRSEKVQKELELLDDQKTKLAEIGEKAAARMREAFSGMQGLGDMSAEERQAKFAEMRKTAAAQAKELQKEIEGVLLPHQIDRLKQIALQLQGVRALNDPQVQKALGLTADQVDKIRSLQQGEFEKMRSMMSGMRDLSDQERREKMQEARKQMEEARKNTEEQIMGVLTADQKAKFDKLKGPKFEVDFSSLMPRGGRRGGGRGPGAAPK